MGLTSYPPDQNDVISFQEQLNLFKHQRESLQVPTKTHTIPDDVLEDIKRLGLDAK